LNYKVLECQIIIQIKPLRNFLTSRPVVIIPTHKTTPLPEEVISLEQCQKVLGARDIYLIIPQGMNSDAYKSILPNLKIYEVPAKYMSSHQAYNQLMISPVIFNYFNQYSHILIHEPDVIVFKDDLDFWCAQGFDYIGAPWFEQNKDGAYNLKATGNFGFALLSTHSVNKLFLENPRWYSISMMIRDIFRGLRGKRASLSRALKACGNAGRISGAKDLYKEHCDIFWSYLVPKIAPSFKVAPPQDALHFSWETHLDQCAKLSKNKLPFGIHAWAKHDPNFLKPFFLNLGIPFNPESGNKKAVKK
jgi:hypothetical protein